MGLQAVLFDLDDTLLGNNTEQFVQHYFALLSAYAARREAGLTNLLPDLLYSTRAMLQDTDPATTNAEVFWSVFTQRLGRAAAELQPFFEAFYTEEFPALQTATQPRPVARPLIQACFERGWQVVIATNPLFPRSAIEQRLAWAGAPVSDFPYALVTSYENMHAAKPQPAYYREILACLDCPAEQALMVGDDWRNDIAPALEVGMRAFWVTDAVEQSPPDAALLEGWGSLDDCYGRLVGDGAGTRRA